MASTYIVRLNFIFSDIKYTIIQTTTITITTNNHCEAREQSPTTGLLLQVHTSQRGGRNQPRWRRSQSHYKPGTVVEERGLSWFG